MAKHTIKPVYNGTWEWRPAFIGNFLRIIKHRAKNLPLIRTAYSLTPKRKAKKQGLNTKGVLKNVYCFLLIMFLSTALLGAVLSKKEYCSHKCEIKLLVERIHFRELNGY